MNLHGILYMGSTEDTNLQVDIVIVARKHSISYKELYNRQLQTYCVCGGHAGKECGCVVVLCAMLASNPCFFRVLASTAQRLTVCDVELMIEGVSPENVVLISVLIFAAIITLSLSLSLSAAILPLSHTPESARHTR